MLFLRRLLTMFAVFASVCVTFVAVLIMVTTMDCLLSNRQPTTEKFTKLTITSCASGLLIADGVAASIVDNIVGGFQEVL